MRTTRSLTDCISWYKVGEGGRHVCHACPLGMHDPPATHPPGHAPLAMHTTLATHIPQPCMPPSQPHMPPSHACLPLGTHSPLAMHAPLQPCTPQAMHTPRPHMPSQPNMPPGNICPQPCMPTGNVPQTPGHTPQPCTSPRAHPPNPLGTPPGHACPPVNRMTDRCKNITLPQTSFAGDNKDCRMKLFSLSIFSISILSWYVHTKRSIILCEPRIRVVHCSH